MGVDDQLTHPIPPSSKPRGPSVSQCTWRTKHYARQCAQDTPPAGPSRPMMPNNLTSDSNSSCSLMASFCDCFVWTMARG